MTYKKVHQFTCTEKETPEDSTVHSSLQNFWSAVWNWLYVTLLTPRIWRWPLYS